MTIEEDKKIKRIKKIYDLMKKKRSSWDSLRQEIADYVLPLREDMAEDEEKGKKKGAKTYDGTAVVALNLFADGIHGNMMSPALKWFVLKLPQKLKFLENIPEVSLWMQDFTDGLYAAFQNSNFYSEMRMFLRDGGSIGTASMFVEEDIGRQKLCFHTLHPREGFIAENQYREIDTFVRQTKYEARQAVAKFGIENVSQRIKDAIERNPFAEFDFLHLVTPRETYDDRKIDRLNMPYESLWVEKNGDKLIRESGFELFPYFVWRYALNGNDIYGSSPASYALPEIKSLNVISKSVLGAAQMAVEPPYNIPAEMKGRERLVPHGRNYYGNDPNRRIYPVFNSGITFPIALDREEKKRELIREHYHVNFFLMLAQSERTMTATEVTEKMGEKASVLGAAIGDLTTTIDNIIDYVSYLEIKAGRIPEPPEILTYHAGGERIDTIYTGTLAQAQRRLLETQSITRSLELVLPLLQVFPDAADVIDSDKSVEKILLSNGYPRDAIRTLEKIAQIRKARTEGQLQENQKVDLERIADVIKKLAQAAKHSGTSLQEMMAQTGMGGQQALPPEMAEV